MANEIDLYDSGEIAPYNEGLPVLAPLSPSPDTWGRTDVLTPREIDEAQRQPQQSQGLMLFGTPMPPGTTPQQVRIILGRVGGVFLSDMSSLNYPNHLIQSAISFFTDNATKAPRQVQRQHNFTLPKDLVGDFLAESFGNHLQGLSGTQQQKQQFLKASFQWLALLNEKLGARGQEAPAQGRAGPTTSTDPLDQLNDAQYAWVVKRNEQIKAQTHATLQQKYGEHSAQQVIALAQNYLESLPAREQKHFDQFTGDWVHSLNTVEVLEFLYNAAIGANNIPKDGPGIARELAAFESMLKIPSERAKYMRDPQLQARYRTLLDLKG
ncbi:hypothetical protein [Pseudomonas sp. Irchel s3b6]|uniref:hypothetical protein n=1 Tax=Pseudomonas sp. Irchel s3b6 TaxID=2009078 RepID=UPI000BA37C9D|nr:hypothetical protein [Pseudomonas sp. Irchel s3b6]